GNTVSTVEHLLAALHGMGVDNCYIEIDSKEVPIMDGSSRDFVDALDVAGLMELSAPRKYIRVIKPICVQDGDCLGEFTPNRAGFRLDVSIDFECPAIGRQNYVCDLSPRVFRTELSRARTFGFMRDVEQLWQKKLALGANLNNTVAIDDEHRVLNAGGLRYTNEFVRHKMLDAVGDLALAGLPILGTYRSVRGGHRLNANALKALLADKSAWVIDSATVAASVPLPNPRGVVETAATVVSRVS
ncbi:MAG: UDP-3-O-acyl-N-acetylglucosamine deacetylase, partial [Pseudomonadota bacterium]